MKLSFFQKQAGVILALFLSLPLLAEVKLPAIFSDNMVLQQKSKVAIWGWAKPNSRVRITDSWSKNSVETTVGNDGKWKTFLETPGYGGPHRLTVSDGKAVTLKNVMIGEVWLCTGQSNMEMPMKGFLGQPVLNSNMDILKSKNSNIRLVVIPRSSKTVPQDDFKGGWTEANPETVSNFSATGYYFGRLLNQMLDIPVGLIDVSYGGSCIQAWMSKNTSVPFEDKKVPNPGDSIPVPNRTPTVLFNGMLNPVIGYTIKGCIWYQGETNYEESDLYQTLFPTMVKEWRMLWGEGNFPFYFTQIAPFDYSVFKKNNPEKNNSAYIRDAQRLCQATIPNSGMAVLMDIGEKDCIHPRHKQVTGERLAMWALGDTYGIKGFEYKSPEYKAMTVKNGEVTVSFDNAENGLTTFTGDSITQFEIAGKDRIFYPATVKLRRKSVILSSSKVPEPVAVRYAFKDYLIGQLFGTNGLPVSSFRTDNW